MRELEMIKFRLNFRLGLIPLEGNSDATDIYNL